MYAVLQRSFNYWTAEWEEGGVWNFYEDCTKALFLKEWRWAQGEVKNALNCVTLYLDDLLFPTIEIVFLIQCNAENALEIVIVYAPLANIFFK